MRRFPVRGLSVLVLVLALSVLPTVAAHAAPWSVVPLDGGWWAKVAQVLVRLVPVPDPAATDPGPDDDHAEDTAVIDPNG
jgi:hypothetical protein